VIARQRPGTAKGTMFLLFEDELGTINLIVAREVYERHRHLARAEPLLLARGRLERAGQDQVIPLTPHSERERIPPIVNVIVRELAPLERFVEGALGDEERAAASARVRHLPDAKRATAAGGEEQEEGVEVGSSMRAVAPPVQSFAQGRRR
jgi:error-prone DNA polymerase